MGFKYMRLSQSKGVFWIGIITAASVIGTAAIIAARSATAPPVGDTSPTAPISKKPLQLGQYNPPECTKTYDLIMFYVHESESSKRETIERGACLAGNGFNSARVTVGLSPNGISDGAYVTSNGKWYWKIPNSLAAKNYTLKIVYVDKKDQQILTKTYLVKVI